MLGNKLATLPGVPVLVVLTNTSVKGSMSAKEMVRKSSIVGMVSH